MEDSNGDWYIIKWFRRDKHRHNRAKTKDGASLSISLLLPGQKKLTGELADIDISGAAASFPAGECPDLERGERIRLSLMSIGSQKALLLDAMVKSSTANRGRILYQFEFLDISHLLENMDSALMTLFSRRGGSELDLIR